jgi:hypothetical protein
VALLPQIIWPARPTFLYPSSEHYDSHAPCMPCDEHISRTYRTPGGDDGARVPTHQHEPSDAPRRWWIGTVRSQEVVAPVCPHHARRQGQYPCADRRDAIVVLVPAPHRGDELLGSGSRHRSWRYHCLSGDRSAPRLDTARAPPWGPGSSVIRVVERNGGSGHETEKSYAKTQYRSIMAYVSKDATIC